MYGIGYLVGTVVLALLVIYPWIKIFQKAGFSGWLTILMFIPVVNLVMLWCFALMEWPARAAAISPRSA